MLGSRFFFPCSDLQLCDFRDSDTLVINGQSTEDSRFPGRGRTLGGNRSQGLAPAADSNLQARLLDDNTAEQSPGIATMQHSTETRYFEYHFQSVHDVTYRVHGNVSIFQSLNMCFLDYLSVSGDCLLRMQRYLPEIPPMLRFFLFRLPGLSSNMPFPVPELKCYILLIGCHIVQGHVASEEDVQKLISMGFERVRSLFVHLRCHFIIGLLSWLSRPPIYALATH